jgi:hypothetical protein
MYILKYFYSVSDDLIVLQFFIGSTETARENQIQNRILSALLLRLMRAVRNHEHFRLDAVIVSIIKYTC